MQICMDETERHRQFEDQFLSQLRAKAGALVRGALPADRVQFESMPDGVDGVRSVLTRLEIFDRDLLHRLPGTQSVQMKFSRKLLGGLVQPTVSRVRAQTLSPIEALVNNETPEPIGRERVLDALARFEVLPRKERPTGVVFASASGFDDGAKALVKSYGPPTLILMGGREDGGWDVTMPAAVRKTAWSKLFELESQDDLLNRLMHHLDQNADLVDSRGLAVDELAEKLGISKVRTEALIRRAVRARSRLMTVVLNDKVHVCRSPLAEDVNSMSIWSRVRKWLRMKPTAAEQVRDLTAKRVKLEAQRYEIDQRVDSIEAEEVKAVKAGAAAKTVVEKKQLAGKLVRLRRELGRHRAQAGVLTKQIDILGTHIHHKTLAERGKRVALPKAEELTAEAAQAEQVMAELDANAELAAGIEVTAEAVGTSEEEEAIMAEFEAAAAAEAGPVTESAAEPASEPSTAETAPAASDSAREPERTAPERPAPTERGDKAGPELG